MKNKQLPKSIDFLSSHGLTVISLLFLMVITIIGTIDQKFIGLYQSQKIYFESIYFTIKLFKANGYVFFLPLPGGYTILAVLFVNLILAFVFKFRWRLRTFGIIVCHIGLLLLLIGSYLTYAYSVHGHMTFAEKEQRGYFVSYTDNEITITEFSEQGEETKSFANNYLYKNSNLLAPSKNIHLQVTHFFQNCDAIRNTDNLFTNQEYVLRKLQPALEAEMNTVGLYTSVYSGKKLIGRYYLYQSVPVVFNYQEKRYSIHIQRRKYPVPFSLKLLKFTRELYPGTQTPKHYESKVTLKEKNHTGEQTEREILISMNRPLRHRGYTFYQSSFNQEQDQMGNTVKYYSTLAVMKNPAEEWPYFSCLLVVLGMIIHFIPKLLRFAQRQGKK
ncbi:cytochrome c biogenesis protein ResB [Candidatus Uabimicrobium sp. HlEnr_7]|uniref:cytochrome c biogenesis protein ResB n=1 Tax=Candidatus Uabimicrobium helgolandensis TaxID=3095367 RepID=UPI003555D5F3